jgi:uncharacterized protein YcbK (DUF882 family)
MSRRRFLRLGGAGLVGLLRPAGVATALDGRRTLFLHNLHTGESARTTYWAEGHYLADGLGQIGWLLRDFRNGEVHAIERRLLDLLVDLRGRLDTREPFEVISGYRSPATNAMLAATTGGVAAGSLHMVGMAIDVRVPGRPLARVRDAALSLGGGGVGYYPTSDFVHVDVGRVRHW